MVKVIPLLLCVFSSLFAQGGSQRKQNKEADREDLTRIEDREQMDRFIKSGLLVRLPQGRGLRIDPRLEKDRRYCRPWTKQMLVDFGVAFYAKFQTSAKITSAVRTVEDQEELRRRNRNAAPTQGGVASTHPTGSTVDISWKDMTRAQIKYVSTYLSLLKEKGKVEYIQERGQRCFHVMVFKTYVAKPRGAQQKKK